MKKVLSIAMLSAAMCLSGVAFAGEAPAPAASGKHLKKASKHSKKAASTKHSKKAKAAAPEAEAK